MNEATWVPFTFRYGIHDVHADDARNAAWADMYPWGSRHASIVDFPAPDERLRCNCPGPRVSAHTRCLLRATQEDFLCDQCRDWCVAIDDAGEYHRLVDMARSSP